MQQNTLFKQSKECDSRLMFKQSAVDLIQSFPTLY